MVSFYEAFDEVKHLIDDRVGFQYRFLEFDHIELSKLFIFNLSAYLLMSNSFH